MEMSSKGIILAATAINDDDDDDDTNNRRSIDRVSDLFAINVITNYGIVGRRCCPCPDNCQGRGGRHIKKIEDLSQLDERMNFIEAPCEVA